jgi:dUTPase
MKSDLSHHHRDTLKRILSHPASGNIEWRQVLSLLNAVGTVDEEHNGKFKVTLGPETEVLERPRGKDIDVQMVVDLRRMLSSAGLGAAGGAT